jgi:hypothetical protein
MENKTVHLDAETAVRLSEFQTFANASSNIAAGFVDSETREVIESSGKMPIEETERANRLSRGANARVNHVEKKTKHSNHQRRWSREHSDFVTRVFTSKTGGSLEKRTKFLMKKLRRSRKSIQNEFLKQHSLANVRDPASAGTRLTKLLSVWGQRDAFRLIDPHHSADFALKQEPATFYDSDSDEE